MKRLSTFVPPTGVTTIVKLIFVPSSKSLSTVKAASKVNCIWRNYKRVRLYIAGDLTILADVVPMKGTLHTSSKRSLDER